MTANKSFHVGDSVVIEWRVLVDDVFTAPSSQLLEVETPITSIVWDPDLEVTVITGGDLSYPSIYLKASDHYGVVYVPTVPGWHRFIIAGWDGGSKLFSRMGTFYVQDATLRPTP